MANRLTNKTVALPASGEREHKPAMTPEKWFTMIATR